MADQFGAPVVYEPVTSLAEVIRRAWARTLFPGAVGGRERTRFGTWALLLVLPGALLYPCMSFRLFEPDEGRYAEIPREMLARGEWIVPYLQGQPYLDKPPLLYWLVMGSYRAFGVHDWVARLVPAVAVHGCVLLTHFFGRRLFGAKAAVWAAIILALAPGFVGVGRLLVLDGLLALWVTLSLLAAFEAIRGPVLRSGWWLLAAVACAFGILTKGPVALVLFVPPLAAYRWLARPPARVGAGAWSCFAAVVSALTLPWYIGICMRTPGFARHFLWEHNVVRFFAPFDHLQPFWFYLPVLAAGLLPASLWAVGFLRFLFSTDPAAAARRSPALGWTLLSGGWCVLFFSLSGCKLATYVLPAFPPLALALGCYMAQRRPAGFDAAKAGLVLMTLCLAVAHYALLPWYAVYHSPLGHSGEWASAGAGPTASIVCYPRNCDSVAFYLGRDDLETYRSKETPTLVQQLTRRPRTVVVFTHRHCLEGLREVLPPELKMTHHWALGLDPSSRIGGLLYQMRALAGERRPELYHLAVIETAGSGGR